MSRDQTTITAGQSYNPFDDDDDDDVDDNGGDGDNEESSWNNTTITTAHRNSARELKRYPQQHPQPHPHLSSEEGWVDPSLAMMGGEAVLLSSHWEAPKLVDTSLESDASDGSLEGGLRRGGEGARDGVGGSLQRFGQPSPDQSTVGNSSGGAGMSSSSSSSISAAARILMEERLSIMFDGNSSDPTCHIIGRLHVRLIPQPTWQKNTNKVSLRGIL
jgi:hypothetical protein